MQALQEARTRVNGKFLAQNSGKPITIVGQVIKVNTNGSAFEIKSTDNQVINIILNEPLDQPLSGWIEVRGTAQGKTNVVCNHFIELPEEIMAKFSADVYDDLVTVINSCANPYNSG